MNFTKPPVIGHKNKPSLRLAKLSNQERRFQFQSRFILKEGKPQKKNYSEKDLGSSSGANYTYS